MIIYNFVSLRQNYKIMSNKNIKYTHLIEKCSSVFRTMTKWRLQETCGYTLSETYWRLREGRGLLSYFDQETLELWSQLITQFRRFAGSPLAIDRECYNSIGDTKSKLLDEMEEYRTWLADGVQPGYLGDSLLFVCEVVQEHFLNNGKKWQEMNESELLEYLRGIDYDVLLKRADEVQEHFRQHCKICEKCIENLEEEERELTMRLKKKEISEKEYTKEIRKIKKAIKMNEYPLLAFYDLEGNRSENFMPVEPDKVWQIRTDIDHRSSKDARISATLNLIWNVASKSTDEHRKIIDENMKVMSEFRGWKADIVAKNKAHKEKYGKSMLYEQNEILGRLKCLLDAIQVPQFPKPEEPE